MAFHKKLTWKPCGSSLLTHVLVTCLFSPGKQGIICLEDLIHEIQSVGKGFRAANNFLLPFELSVPRYAAKDKVGILKDVGNPGFRGSDVNAIIRLLNWGPMNSTFHFQEELRNKEDIVAILVLFLYLEGWETWRPGISSTFIRSVVSSVIGATPILLI